MKCNIMKLLVIKIKILFFLVVGSNGEVLLIHNISRYCDDVYECVAFNDISPAASREIRVVVECKYGHVTVQT